MNYSDYRFTLDIQIHQAQVSIPVTFGDSARRLCIGLTDGRKPYTIGEGCIAVFNGKKPDGTSLKNSCIIERNAIVYEFTEQTTNCEGVVKCDLTLYGADGKILTSPQFIIVVDKRVVRDEDVPVSQDQATAISDMITAEAYRQQNEDERIAEEKVRDAEESGREKAEATRRANEAQRIEDYVKAEQAEAERCTAERARADAEDLRVEAEEWRQTKERQRVDEENVRGNNEYARVTAEEARVEAENARAEAEAIRERNESDRKLEMKAYIDEQLENISGDEIKAQYVYAEEEVYVGDNDDVVISKNGASFSNKDATIFLYGDNGNTSIKGNGIDTPLVMAREVAVGENDEVVISETGIALNGDSAHLSIHGEEVATKKYVQDAIDNIDMALDAIIAIQNELIGGDA